MNETRQKLEGKETAILAGTLSTIHPFKNSLAAPGLAADSLSVPAHEQEDQQRRGSLLSTAQPL